MQGDHAAAPSPVSIPDEEDEKLIPLPLEEKMKDPYYKKMIKKHFLDQNEVFFGTVDDIELGKVSKERLYFVRYDDDDAEHMTLSEVKRCYVPDSHHAGQGVTGGQNGPVEEKE